MKKTYLPLMVSVDFLEDEDILTASGDDSLLNGGLFGGGEDKNGWT